MLLNDSSNNFIIVKVYYMYREDEFGKRVVVVSDKKAEEMLSNIDEANKKQVQILSTQWRQLSWKDQKVIVKQSASISDPVTGSVNFDLYGFRDARIKACLKKWNLTDDEQNPIPVTPENIDFLPADIVFALQAKFDAAVEVSEEEMGK